MAYSRGRLALVAFAWMAFGAMMFVAHPMFGAQGQAPTARMCGSPPCEFPMEQGESGIIMGTTFMNGTQVHYNNCDPSSPGPCLYNTPNGGEEPVARLGVDDVQPVGLFLYKQWKYYDSRTGAYEDTYIWFNVSSNAELYQPGGSTGCSGNNCDLLAYLSELAAPDMSARAFGITFNLQDYWAINPQDDICSFVNADTCLETAGEGNAFIRVNNVPTYFRIHKLAAGPQASEPRILRLNNVSAEIRYGDGRDSVHNVYSNDPTQLMSVSHTCKGNPQEPADGNAQCDRYEDDADTNVEWYPGGSETNYKSMSKYNNPVVITSKFNDETADPITPWVGRVGNGNWRSNFDMHCEEWFESDGGRDCGGLTISDNIFYMVGDLGHFTLDGTSTDVEFGTIDSPTDTCCNTETFDQSFDTTPVVFTEPNSDTDYGCGWYCGTYDDTFTMRIQNVDTNGFEHQMQEKESRTDGHQSQETIAYMAIEQDNDEQSFIDTLKHNTSNDDYSETYQRDFEVGTMSGVSDAWHTINFEDSYRYPIVFFKFQTRNGADPGFVRWRNLGSNSVEVQFDEGTSSDTETGHVDETIGYMVMEGNSYYGNDYRRAVFTRGVKSQGCGGFGSSAGCGGGSVS